MSEETPAADRLLKAALGQVATHALILLDPAGVVVAWLAGSERLLGYAPAEIVGRNAEVLFTPEDLAKNLAARELRTAEAAGVCEDDRWQVRKDTGRIWTSGTLTALRGGGGELLGFAKILQDRSDQKLQTDTLEARIAALQRADRAKNTFISTLGHELRSPLAALSGAADALAKCATAAPEAGMALGVVRGQIDFMRRIIADVLEAARSAAGKVQLHREPVVLQAVIATALETVRAAAEERRRRLEPLLPDVPVSLEADPTRLAQVVANLVRNACGHSPPGGTVWVTATAEGDEAVVRVRDAGAGISAEVMPHIFELFTQAEPAGNRRGGLGIGLSLVRDYVALHGGTVQATSDGPGKGSEFTVRLPLPRA